MLAEEAFDQNDGKLLAERTSFLILKGIESLWEVISHDSLVDSHLLVLQLVIVDLVKIISL